MHMLGRCEMNAIDIFRHVGAGFLFVCVVGLPVTGCDSPITIGDSGGSAGSAGHAPVIGTTFCDDPFPGDLCEAGAAFGAQCTAEGGFYDYCNNVKCTQLPQCGTTICHPPPPPPTANEFGCTWITCPKGKMCEQTPPLGDGCSYVSCEDPPAACASTLTCACLATAGYTTNCKEDADGNVFTFFFGL